MAALLVDRFLWTLWSLMASHESSVIQARQATARLSSGLSEHRVHRCTARGCGARGCQLYATAAQNHRYRELTRRARSWECNRHAVLRVKERHPMIVTAGQQDTRMRLKEPVLGHELTQMAAPVTKWSVQAERADELADIMRRAFKIAHEEPAGPVFCGPSYRRT